METHFPGLVALVRGGEKRLGIGATTAATAGAGAGSDAATAAAAAAAGPAGGAGDAATGSPSGQEGVVGGDANDDDELTGGWSAAPPAVTLEETEVAVVVREFSRRWREGIERIHAR